jgi:hypothetical protein
MEAAVGVGVLPVPENESATRASTMLTSTSKLKTTIATWVPFLLVRLTCSSVGQVNPTGHYNTRRSGHKDCGYVAVTGRSATKRRGPFQ